MAKLTPLDIRHKEFRRAMRGYSDEDVDVFLDDVADEFERLFQENIDLNERMQRLEEQIADHQKLRETLEKTLISAQQQSDEMRANARKESELILRDAELKSRDLVNESYKETQRVQQSLMQLRRLEEEFRFKFRSLLNAHLKLLSEEEQAGAAEVLSVEPESVAAELPAEASVAEPAGVAETTRGDVPVVAEEPSVTVSPAPEVLAAALAEDEVTENNSHAPQVREEPTEDQLEAPVRRFYFGRKPEEENDFFGSSKDRDFDW